MPKTFHEHVDTIRKNVNEITAEEVMKMKKNNEKFRLIDIREDNEFFDAHIKGATHIGKGIIERDIHKFTDAHDEKLVLYCGGGYRSVIAADALQQMGYTNVLSMTGGWKEWNRLGGEIES